MPDSLPSDVFARRMRVERERRGLSQAELGRRMASDFGTVLDPSAITRIEQQTRAVRLDEAVAIASALEVSLGSLIDDEDRVQRQLVRSVAELATVRAQWDRLGREMDRLTAEIRQLRGAAPQHTES